MKPHQSRESRFWSKVDKNGPIPEHRPDLGPCWVWTASYKPNGYGQFHFGEPNINISAHEVTTPDRPPGLERDHLCRNRGCVRPSHIEFVTRKVNNARGNSPTAMNARKVYCKRGHLITVRGKGTKCRTCHLAYMRQYHKDHPGC